MSITRYLLLSGLSLVLVLTGCGSTAFDREADGIVLHLQPVGTDAPRLLRLQVCTADIIRVLAAPGDSFSSRPNLVVARDHWDAVPWSVQERGDAVELSTDDLTVRVDTHSGSLSFFDSTGRALLRETEGGGKSLTPADVMGERTYHVRQVFESSDDEAFYGLGQHQNGVLNYKGKDVDLSPYNIIAANPFLVSSKNYGILWDNNSLTRFGDTRDYEPISSLTLLDSEGKRGGLTAEYFGRPDLRSPVTRRVEDRIEHRYTDVSDAYPEGFDANRGSVRWSGAVQAEESGIYKLRLYSSSFTRMWLDDDLVVDSWRQNWLPWTHNLQFPLNSGERKRVRIEWVPQGGFIGLGALPPDPSQNPQSLSLYSEVGDQIDYYFVRGDDLDQVIHGYREITGTAPMMPKWAMGLWQCRERYRTQDELLSVVREFRKRGLPLDNIVQDWFYWKEDQWGSHEFDESRYPDPVGMVKELHDRLNARIMISVWPKFYVGTRHFDEFEEKGWLYERNIEKGQRDWVGPGYVSTFYDPYSPDARALYWRQIAETLFPMGMDAWWMDATEPDIQSNLSGPETRLRMNPTAIGTAARYLNTYSLEQSRAVFEGQMRSDPDRRVVILTRSAWAGQQRYGAATWSGDTATRWEDLRNQIPAGLNFSVSGIPYWTNDIGGFAVEPRFTKPNREDLEEWRELMTRWFQFGAFCPLFRVHGQFPYREIYNVAPENHPAYRAMAAYDELRYRLMPYIYSLAGMVTHDDYTIMRPLVMDFGDDPDVRNIGSQFMFGPSLLVNPVTEYKARTLKVYLPASTGWYALRSGRFFDGGRSVDADAPYSDIPIFVRAGSILPFGPAIESCCEQPADPIRLMVYMGQDGSFTLYEDEGVNNDYRDGAFSRIPVRFSEANRELTIGARQGSYPGMTQTRTFEIVWVGRDRPVPLDLEAAPATVVAYDGDETVVKPAN